MWSPAILSMEGIKKSRRPAACWCYTAADNRSCVTGEQGGTTKSLQDRTFMKAWLISRHCSSHSQESSSTQVATNTRPLPKIPNKKKKKKGRKEKRKKGRMHKASRLGIKCRFSMSSWGSVWLHTFINEGSTNVPIGCKELVNFCTLPSYFLDTVPAANC